MQRGRTHRWTVGSAWSWLMIIVGCAMMVWSCEEPKPKPQACQTTAECGGGQVCNGGVCGNCSDDSACGKGTLCVTGLCRLGCRDNSGCDPGKRCEQGVCIGGCSDNKACPNGQTCSNGACRAGCATRADCKNDEYCDTKSGTCQECLVDANCKSGFTCLDGTCTCPKENQCGQNQCIDISTDASNCGLCGVLCSQGLCRDKICRMVARSVSLGGTHSCSVLKSGGVMCWGANSFGELGNGEQQDQLAPVAANGITNARQLSLLGRLEKGNSSSCVVHNDGLISCWGSNTFGELGSGTNEGSLTPLVIKGLTNVLQLASGRGTMVNGVAAGYHRCALLQDSRVWCWGSNQQGELGDKTKLNRNLPTLVEGLNDVVEIAAGGGHTCALQRSGRVWCWGNNTDGQLGIRGPALGTFAPIDVFDIDNAVSIGVGVHHTCAVLKSGGVKCWGRNNDGQLGDGTKESRRTPVEVKGVTDVVSVSAGLWHTCAVQRSGRALCWGRNKLGVLGRGSLLDEVRGPTKLPFEDVIQMATGLVHTCVIRKSNESVWCWGQGDSGQLGNRERLAVGEPTQVVEE